MFPNVKAALKIYSIIIVSALMIKTFIKCKKGSTAIVASLLPTVIYLLNI